jgi:pimeloyl-ACP methyl ester carboxylesterase
MNSSYLLANDLRVHYYHWLPEKPSRPILLLHGLASNARFWEWVAPQLAGSGMAAYALDLRGHGLTDKPEDHYDFEVINQDIRAFLEVCTLERPILVGHSWGGMVALAYAVQYSRGPHAPAGIVLVDGGIVQLNAIPGITWEYIRERLTPPRLAGLPLEKFLEHLRQPKPHWQPDERAIQIILGNFEISEDETITPHLRFENHMSIVRHMWDFNTYEYYERLRCPALLVPANPPAPPSPDDAEYLALKKAGVEHVLERNSSVSVYWMPDAIHDIPLQLPTELAKLISDFAETLP